MTRPTLSMAELRRLFGQANLTVDVFGDGFKVRLDRMWQP
jgi:hypothetical protein